MNKEEILNGFINPDTFPVFSLIEHEEAVYKAMDKWANLRIIEVLQEIQNPNGLLLGMKIKDKIQELKSEQPIDNPDDLQEVFNRKNGDE